MSWIKLRDYKKYGAESLHVCVVNQSKKEVTCEGKIYTLLKLTSSRTESVPYGSGGWIEGHKNETCNYEAWLVYEGDALIGWVSQYNPMFRSDDRYHLFRSNNPSLILENLCNIGKKFFHKKTAQQISDEFNAAVGKKK